MRRRPADRVAAALQAVVVVIVLVVPVVALAACSGDGREMRPARVPIPPTTPPSTLFLSDAGAITVPLDPPTVVTVAADQP